MQPQYKFNNKIQFYIVDNEGIIPLPSVDKKYKLLCFSLVVSFRYEHQSDGSFRDISNESTANKQIENIRKVSVDAGTDICLFRQNSEHTRSNLTIGSLFFL